MTWAPRGIFSTTSASVGRNTKNSRPVEPTTVAPSVLPMMSSWARMPAWVWKVSPSRSFKR